ncbi:MAG: zinc-ribbon domain-containing protein [Planktomarina sp.]
MRITCTNCEAEYEVPDNAIPRLGREVQCSNCGHTWFVNPKPLVELETAHAAQPDHADHKIEQTSAPETETHAPAPQAPVESVSEKAKAVLQAEAERELRARQAEAEADLQTQPDLGLDQAEPETDDYDHPAPETADFADLPSIDDIDEDLTAATKAKVKKQKAKQAPTPKRKGRRRGFRRGFMTSVIIMGGFAAVYAFAPQISDAQPRFADEINSYVVFVNDLRQNLFMWADDLVKSIENMGPTSPTDQN